MNFDFYDSCDEYDNCWVYTNDDCYICSLIPLDIPEDWIYHEHCHVQILRNSTTGAISVGWFRT